MKQLILKPTAIVLLSSLAFSSQMVLASDNDFAKTEKELKIMSRIFETSLEDASNRQVKLIGSKSVQSTYLAKQGMVFEFNFGRNAFAGADWEAFGEGIGQMVGAIASEVSSAFAEAPMAPMAPSAPVDIEVERWEHEVESHFDAYQERIEALEEMRERHREQREEVRDLQREIRSLERKSIREESESRELEKVRVKLEEKIKVLDKKMAEYKQSMEEYRKKRDQKYTESIKLKSKSIFTTLCDYGATMRSLKSGEHVTLIFKNYQDSKDQIFVFDKDDIQDCKSAEWLTNKAITYLL